LRPGREGREGDAHGQRCDAVTPVHVASFLRSLKAAATYASNEYFQSTHRSSS
jgi:hypothetical protein